MDFTLCTHVQNGIFDCITVSTKISHDNAQQGWGEGGVGKRFRIKIYTYLVIEIIVCMRAAERINISRENEKALQKRE